MKQLISIFLLLSLPLHILAYSFRSLNVKDGLSSRQIYRIAQDSTGFIWIHTSIGIDVYDGTEIRHYNLGEKDRNTETVPLPMGFIECDRKGHPWVSTYTGKLYRYDKEADFFRLTMDLEKKGSPGTVYDLFSGSDGMLWIATEKGLICYSPEDNKIKTTILKGIPVYSRAEINRNEFYVGTRTGIWEIRKRNDGTFEETDLHFPYSMRVRSLCLIGQKLYIGTFGNGIWSMDCQTNRFEPIPGVPHVAINTLKCGTDNQLMAGVDGVGLYILDTKTDRILKHYKAGTDSANGLTANSIVDLCLDRNNTLWVSTYTGGVFYSNPKWMEVSHINIPSLPEKNIEAQHINIIIEDRDGDLWYGTNQGVSTFNNKQQQWHHYLTSTKLRNHEILALAEDDNGNIWAGGYGLGVWKIQKTTGKEDEMPLRNGNNKKGISTPYIYTICNHQGRLWIGGIEGAMTCYDPKNDTYAYLPQLDCMSAICPSLDNKGLLIASCNSLIYLDTRTRKTKEYKKFGNTSLNCPVRSIIQSSDGTAWLATDGQGLIKFNPQTGESRTYNLNDGLWANLIGSVAEDEKGRIWFTTEKNMYCLTNHYQTPVSVNKLLNIEWGNFNRNAALRLKDGKLAFGTAEGAIVFHPNKDWITPDSIPIILTDFQLLYKSVKAGEQGAPLNNSINNTSKINLTNKQNSFSVAFSALNFTTPWRMKYEYRMLGHIDEWQEVTDKSHRISFMNLPWGKYKFQLRITDRYDGRLLGERTLNIYISSPRWLSWWAICIYILIIGSITSLVILNIYHKHNEKRFQQRINSFVGLTHDLSTPISLIKAPLKQLEEQTELSEEGYQIISIITHNVEKILEMTGGLLELQRSGYTPNNKYLKLELTNLNDYLNDKVENFHPVAVQKALNLKFKASQDLCQVLIDKKIMDHIIDNLLQNALKYTEHGSVTVELQHNKSKWVMKIADTGIGIPVEARKYIFQDYYRAQNVGEKTIGSGIGLMLVRQLVTQHQGKITFTSQEGIGSTFIISFPNKPKGTIIKGTTNEEINYIEKESASSNQIQAKENTLLLVEDDTDMCRYLEKNLSAEYKIVCAQDGGKALEIARNINPDIILTDVVMPVIQGDELCRILKTSLETSHIPIILLTALNERENIIHGLEIGANDYITKPFDLSVLKARIRNILHNRQMLRNTVLNMEQPTEEIDDYASQMDKEFLDKTMQIIQENLSDCEYSVNELCKSLCMSRTSVYNKIKTLTGLGPNDYIRIVRLNKAKELLNGHRYSIAEVSTMVGFSDPKYFSTCFKKKFGISPSKL